MNDLYGTSVHTFAAVYALIVVDRSVEVLDFDSAVRTFFLAHFTAYTAVFASEFGSLSVVARRAEDVDMLALWLD